MGEERQRRVMDTFVELADTLASDYEVAEFLQVLVERCAELLGADTAGVLLETSTGDLRLAAGISAEMREIEDLGIRLGEGPCLDAYRLGEPVIAEDMTDFRDRWPRITPRILDIGMRSAYAFPLRLRGDRIGALNLYRARPGSFDDDDIRLGQAFADVATIGILQDRRISAAERRAEQLQHALDSRVVIEQAKGILAQRHGIAPEEAFQALRAHARRNHLKVHDLSSQVVAGTAPDILLEG